MKKFLFILLLISSLLSACYLIYGDAPHPKVYIIPNKAQIKVVDTNCIIKAIYFYVYPDDTTYFDLLVINAPEHVDYLSDCSLFDLDTNRIICTADEKKKIALLHTYQDSTMLYEIKKIEVKCKGEKLAIALRIGVNGYDNKVYYGGEIDDTLYFNIFSWDYQAN